MKIDIVAILIKVSRFYIFNALSTKYVSNKQPDFEIETFIANVSLIIPRVEGVEIVEEFIDKQTVVGSMSMYNYAFSR